MSEPLQFELDKGILIETLQQRVIELAIQNAQLESLVKQLQRDSQAATEDRPVAAYPDN